MVALLIGVFLVMASRTHCNQMVVNFTGTRNIYSAMNVVYQVAYLVVQLPTGLLADSLNPVTMLATIITGLAVTSAVSPFALNGLSLWSWTPWTSAIPVIVTGTIFAINGALAGSWWPFMNVMLSNWAPPEKLAYMYATINTGLPGGIVVGNIFTGFFYSLHGFDFGYSFFVITVSILYVSTKAVLSIGHIHYTHITIQKIQIIVHEPNPRWVVFKNLFFIQGLHCLPMLNTIP